MIPAPNNSEAPNNRPLLGWKKGGTWKEEEEEVKGERGGG